MREPTPEEMREFLDYARRYYEEWYESHKDKIQKEVCEHEYTPNADGTMEWCQKCDSVRPRF